MATTTIIPLHAGKGRTVATALGLSVDYVENPEKTDDGEPDRVRPCHEADTRQPCFRMLHSYRPVITYYKSTWPIKRQ
jgi:hypothetical protein